MLESQRREMLEVLLLSSQHRQSSLPVGCSLHSAVLISPDTQLEGALSHEEHNSLEAADLLPAAFQLDGLSECGQMLRLRRILRRISLCRNAEIHHVHHDVQLVFM